MAKKDHFLQQLQRTMHLKQAPSHVDKPSEETLEQLEAETKRAELEKTKAETGYWEDRREANTTGDGPVFGLASNNKRRKFFGLPKRKRPSWK